MESCDAFPFGKIEKTLLFEKKTIFHQNLPSKSNFCFRWEILMYEILMKEYTGLQLITCNYDINRGFSQSLG